jgi:hypothetical protein
LFVTLLFPNDLLHIPIFYLWTLNLIRLPISSLKHKFVFKVFLVTLGRSENFELQTQNEFQANSNLKMFSIFSARCDGVGVLGQHPVGKDMRTNQKPQACHPRWEHRVKSLTALLLRFTRLPTPSFASHSTHPLIHKAHGSGGQKEK